jgi:hypothetical protein
MARRILRKTAPWAIMAALVLLALLKFSNKSPVESLLICGTAISIGLAIDRLASQFAGHILGSWDRGS